MTVYVDDVRHPYRGMIMCHMWADTVEELLKMADRIGIARKHLQQAPKASWLHFDVCLDRKAKAIRAGAVLTDRYGPVEYEARRDGNQAKLDMIARCRALQKMIGAGA